VGVLILRSPSAVVAQSALDFPSNGDSPSGQLVGFKFSSPHLDGLPLFGVDGDGITWIREYTPYPQAGYYVVHWYAAASTDFLTDTYPNYYGLHPYPLDQPRSTETTHYWELAGVGFEEEEGDGSHIGDNLLTRAGTRLEVVKDVKYLQALRMTRNTGTQITTAVGYLNLPSTANSNVIEVVSDNTYGDSNPNPPEVFFGDSRWAAGVERLSGKLGRIKIFNKPLTEADMLLEAADMSQIVTVAGAASIWWGKSNWLASDLSGSTIPSDFGVSRNMDWVNSNRPTLVAA
jgi:hypothetical protein